MHLMHFCRGPYCIYAHRAVTTLRKHELTVPQLVSSLPEWCEEGREVLSSHIQLPQEDLYP